MTATQTTIADQPRKDHAPILSRIADASRRSIARVGATSRRIAQVRAGRHGITRVGAASRRAATRGQLGPSVGHRDDLVPEKYL